MVNDTGGLKDPAMIEVVGRHQSPAVLMYLEGSHPHAVEELTLSEDKSEMITESLAISLSDLSAAGIDKVIIDPGIAINYPVDYAAYTRQQLRVIRGIDGLRALGAPILVPIPRKAELTRTVAYITMALEYGADIIRVHDVAVAADLVRLFDRERT